MMFRRGFAMWDNGWCPASLFRKLGYYPSRRLTRDFVRRRMELPRENGESDAMSELVL
jgi:hypothetical protein